MLWREVLPACKQLLLLALAMARSHTWPAWVNHLGHTLRQIGINTQDNNFDLSVPAWFVHHDNIRRWTAPRLLQLLGLPHTWDMQLSTLWIDVIIAHEWYEVTLIQPDPPRIPRHRFVDL